MHRAIEPGSRQTALSDRAVKAGVIRDLVTAQTNQGRRFQWPASQRHHSGDWPPQFYWLPCGQALELTVYLAAAEQLLIRRRSQLFK